MTRLLISRDLPETVMEAARARFEVETREEDAPMTPAQMRSALALYDGVLCTLGDRFDADIFAEFEAPRCRILANFGVGYNHIDAAAARAAGITVTNTPGAVTDATADIALTLMLMSCRRAAEGERLVRSGTWPGWAPTQMLGLHMSGKRVGILGLGRIGLAIAARAHYGFGMAVSYTARSPKETPFPAHFYSDARALAAAVDVLVVAVPGSAATHHLVGSEVIGAMAPHAHLINISRGDVIDETALIAALQEGRIGGAGLDVYEHEPAVPEALRALDQVTLLPHLGTAALEVREAMGRMALDNLVAFFNGETPPNLVN